jgi:GNAT superfamily N-acetyltransferase
MTLCWIREHPPKWDSDKERIIAGAGLGVFDIGPYRTGDLLTGDWWRVQDRESHVVAFGWIDTLWGDAATLLAVDPEARGGGVGTFVLDRLEEEAAGRGINYLYNFVRFTHPDRDRVVSWLLARGFEMSADGLFRRRTRRDVDRV